MLISFIFPETEPNDFQNENKTKTKRKKHAPETFLISTFQAFTIRHRIFYEVLLHGRSSAYASIKPTAKRQAVHRAGLSQLCQRVIISVPNQTFTRFVRVRTHVKRLSFNRAL